MSGKNQYVVTVGKKWGVRGEGNSRLTKITNTKEESVEKAKEIAKKQKSNVIYQDNDSDYSKK